MKSFQELKLPAELEKALASMNFQIPTPIQAQTIPFALEGRDVIGCAQTGTGKTAAFCLPMIAKLLSTPSDAREQTMGLVLAPTRELALQIDEVARKLLVAAPHIKTAILIGGTSMQPQMRALQKRPRLVIATPGRLVDHMQRRTISLKNVTVLVLDEADRMLDMGFMPQVERILRETPKTRQTFLFSATMPGPIENIGRKFMNSPERIAVGPVSKPIEKIEQKSINVTSAQKTDVLMDEINAREGSILVFVRTQRRADRLARQLEDYGLEVARLHGGRTQAQRQSALNGFKLGRFRLLVATDIAARGIDANCIAHVVNYDLPASPEDYVHRIGRTARAGADGCAISLIAPEEKHLWSQIQRMNKAAGASVTISTTERSVHVKALPNQASSQAKATPQSEVTEPRPFYERPRMGRPGERAPRPLRGGYGRSRERDFDSRAPHAPHTPRTAYGAPRDGAPKSAGPSSGKSRIVLGSRSQIGNQISRSPRASWAKD